MSYSRIHLKNIKTLASKKGLTLTDLANKLGITYVGISKIIRENSTSLSTLTSIADSLDVPLPFFFIEPSELPFYLDFNVDNYKKLKIENEALKKEIDDLKNKIIRLADKI